MLNSIASPLPQTPPPVVDTSPQGTAQAVLGRLPLTSIAPVITTPRSEFQLRPASSEVRSERNSSTREKSESKHAESVAESDLSFTGAFMPFIAQLFAQTEPAPQRPMAYVTLGSATAGEPVNSAEIPGSSIDIHESARRFPDYALDIPRLSLLKLNMPPYEQQQRAIEAAAQQPASQLSLFI